MQSRIYSLTFIESLEINFTQYKETYEVLIYYPTILGKNIKYDVKIQLGIFLMQILMFIVEG